MLWGGTVARFQLYLGAFVLVGHATTGAFDPGHRSRGMRAMASPRSRCIAGCCRPPVRVATSLDDTARPPAFVPPRYWIINTDVSAARAQMKR